MFQKLFQLSLLNLFIPGLLVFAEVSSPTPALLKEVEKKYSASQTLSTEFQQKQYVKAYDMTKESKGVLLIQRPNKIRWEVKSPDQTIMLTSGSEIKIYTPPFDETDHGQLIIERAEKIHSQFVRDLLAGSFSLLKGIQTKTLNETEFRLTPLKKKSIQGVIEANVKINKTNLTIETITLIFSDGNKTEIKFNNLEIGKVIAANQFELTLPQKTDIIDRTQIKK